MEHSNTFFLLFKISTGTRKISFGICSKFGYVPSKRFASPDLDKSLQLCNKGESSQHVEEKEVNISNYRQNFLYIREVYQKLRG